MDQWKLAKPRPKLKRYRKKNGLQTGDLVEVYPRRKGHLRFIGETKFADGIMFGVELHRPTGRHSGVISGHKYFESRRNCALFVRRRQIKRLKKKEDLKAEEVELRQSLVDRVTRSGDPGSPTWSWPVGISSPRTRTRSGSRVDPAREVPARVKQRRARIKEKARLAESRSRSRNRAPSRQRSRTPPAREPGRKLKSPKAKSRQTSVASGSRRRARPLRKKSKGRPKTKGAMVPRKSSLPPPRSAGASSRRQPPPSRSRTMVVEFHESGAVSAAEPHHPSRHPPNPPAGAKPPPAFTVQAAPEHRPQPARVGSLPPVHGPSPSTPPQPAKVTVRPAPAAASLQNLDPATAAIAKDPSQTSSPASVRASEGLKRSPPAKSASKAPSTESEEPARTTPLIGSQLPGSPSFRHANSGSSNGSPLSQSTRSPRSRTRKAHRKVESIISLVKLSEPPPPQTRPRSASQPNSNASANSTEDNLEPSRPIRVIKVRQHEQPQLTNAATGSDTENESGYENDHGETVPRARSSTVPSERQSRRRRGPDAPRQNHQNSPDMPSLADTDSVASSETSGMVVKNGIRKRRRKGRWKRKRIPLNLEDLHKLTQYPDLPGDGEYRTETDSEGGGARRPGVLPLKVRRQALEEISRRHMALKSNGFSKGSLFDNHNMLQLLGRVVVKDNGTRQPVRSSSLIALGKKTYGRLIKNSRFIDDVPFIDDEMELELSSEGLPTLILNEPFANTPVEPPWSRQHEMRMRSNEPVEPPDPDPELTPQQVVLKCLQDVESDEGSGHAVEAEECVISERSYSDADIAGMKRAPTRELLKQMGRIARAHSNTGPPPARPRIRAPKMKMASPMSSPETVPMDGSPRKTPALPVTPTRRPPPKDPIDARVYEMLSPAHVVPRPPAPHAALTHQALNVNSTPPSEIPPTPPPPNSTPRTTSSRIFAILPDEDPFEQDTAVNRTGNVPALT